MRCHRRAFYSRRDAKRALQSARQVRPHQVTTRVEQRFYRCDRCGAWHLTSQTLEEYEAALEAA